jgi:hypothetical protein
MAVAVHVASEGDDPHAIEAFVAALGPIVATSRFWVWPSGPLAMIFIVSPPATRPRSATR